MGVKVYELGCHGRPVVAVHGGAGRWKRRFTEEAKRALEEAVRRGLRLLLSGGSCLDAVVEATAVLEDSGEFNAGVGSVLTIDGRVEMDAGIIVATGEHVRAAAVAAVSYPRNPIRLARLVLEKTSHVLLAGEGADMLARKLGLERHPGPSPRALERWKKLLEEAKRGGGPSWARSIVGLYDTVGAVALDAHGGLAASASTGGLILKAPGRVGDSAIPHAGFDARPGVAACSATGVGETILMGLACHRVLELVAEGIPVVEAVRAVVARHTRLYGDNTVGLLVVDASGTIVAGFNTEAMTVAYASKEKLEAMLLD